MILSLAILVLILLLILLLLFLLVNVYQRATNVIYISKKRLDGKTALVTGGTAGMGIEIATDFARRGARVIVACPFADEGLQALHTIIKNSGNQNVEYKHLDLASFESTRKFAADILKNEDRLDILVNNAGVGGPGNGVSHDGLNFLMQVNYYSAVLLTILILPLLKKTGCPGEPSRIVNTSSVLHTVGRVNLNNLDATWCLLQVYGNSKLYIILFSRALSIQLQNSNVVINNVDPGLVGTRIYQGINRYFGFFAMYLCFALCQTPWQGAQTALHVALDREAGEVSGEFFKNCKKSRAIRIVYNNKVAQKLLEETIRLVKLTDAELDLCFKSL